ncbi:tetratricopeptide-like helical domain-containing protein [Artemisia annua]|uniref:Tetratricopeptide-like helical domain-containing protein n=1 Tax=Artemisia annua TaxID=35608 RepID=A0A2U1NWG4_ARTAN|nr:tetratricopeptide-like helical domain-containing protein [Artemisia annua]
MVLRSNSAAYSFIRLQLGIRISPFSASFHSQSSPKPFIVTNLNDALKVFDEMSQAHPLPSVVEFTQLLNDITKMKHFSSSIRLFNRMCALGVPVNEYTMSIVINCCCHLHRSNDAFAVLGSCFKRDIVPNTAIFNTLLNGLVVEGRIREAERLLVKVITNKLCEPNVVMYSTMIKGLCKTRDYVQAVGLLKLMDKSGCKPNVVAYSTVIDSMCKHKMIDDAFKIYKEMVFQKGIPPDAVTYNSLIPGLCKVGRSKEASKMLKEMSDDQKMSPNVKTFTILVDALCKEGKLEEAEAVIKSMPERDILPNIVTYNSLINGYCLQGEMSKARTDFDSLASRCLIPNVVTYNTLLKGYCNESKIDEAMHIFNEITERGLEPDVVTYTTMLQGLFRGKRCEDAKELFLIMKETGCSPNDTTYNVLLHGCLKNQQYDDVKMLLVEMDERGYLLWASNLSLLQSRIAAKILDESLFELICKLEPENSVNASCLDT